MQIGASCSSVKGSGWAFKKCAIEPGGALDTRWEKGAIVSLEGGSAPGSWG